MVVVAAGSRRAVRPPTFAAGVARSTAAPNATPGQRRQRGPRWRTDGAFLAPAGIVSRRYIYLRCGMGEKCLLVYIPADFHRNVRVLGPPCSRVVSYCHTGCQNATRGVLARGRANPGADRTRTFAHILVLRPLAAGPVSYVHRTAPDATRGALAQARAGLRGFRTASLARADFYREFQTR